MKPICRGAGDLAVQLKVRGVTDGTNAPADTQGTLAVTVRMTFADPMNGAMTVVPVSGNVPLQLLNGAGAVKTTLSIILGESGFPQIPNANSLDIEDVELRDPNGNAFARPGVFLP